MPEQSLPNTCIFWVIMALALWPLQPSCPLNLGKMSGRKRAYVIGNMFHPFSENLFLRDPVPIISFAFYLLSLIQSLYSRRKCVPLITMLNIFLQEILFYMTVSLVLLILYFRNIISYIVFSWLLYNVLYVYI